MTHWFAVGIKGLVTVIWIEQGGDTDRWVFDISDSSDSCTYSCNWIFFAIFGLAAEIWTDRPTVCIRLRALFMEGDE